MEKITIPVKQFRRLNDPFEETSKERPIKFRFYVNTKDVPEILLEWMQTNPRRQNLKTATAKSIAAALSEDNQSFHLWNRGILLSVVDITFDNRTNLATLYMSDPTIHGDIDGGHTLRIIIEHNKKLAEAEKLGKSLEDFPEQYVEFEAITNLNSSSDLAEARNTSVAVDKKTIEELNHSFDLLKKVMDGHLVQGEAYIKRIETKQNQARAEQIRNPIDIREIVSIFNMFNQRLYPNKRHDPFDAVSPIQSFTGKEYSLERFLDMGLPDTVGAKKQRQIRETEIQHMTPILRDIIDLWDYIECHFTEATTANGKRYGAKKYANYNPTTAEEKLPKSMFSNKPLRYTVPKGILYPLVGSFRALVRLDENGDYDWIVPPLQAWDELKNTLAEYVMSSSGELGNSPGAIGKSKSLWNTLYLTVCSYANNRELMNLESKK